MRGIPATVIQAEAHPATGLGPERHVLWEGRHALPDMGYPCGGFWGPGGTYVSEDVLLRYGATGTTGIEAARCERCSVAWGRTVGG